MVGCSYVESHYSTATVTASIPADGIEQTKDLKVGEGIRLIGKNGVSYDVRLAEVFASSSVNAYERYIVVCTTSHAKTRRGLTLA
jgi:hypothetical protein